MNIFKVIKKVLSEPTDFFTRVKQGKNHVGFSWVYFALLSLFNTILGSIMFIIDYYIFLPTLEKDPIFGKLFSAAFSELIIVLVLFSSWICSVPITSKINDQTILEKPTKG